MAARASVRPASYLRPRSRSCRGVRFRTLPCRNRTTRAATPATDRGSRACVVTICAAAAAAATFLAWRAQARSFEGLAAFDWGARNLTGGSEPVRIQAATVSANFFDVLGVGPALGRTFVAEPGREAVISDGLWRRLLGGQ